MELKRIPRLGYYKKISFIWDDFKNIFRNIRVRRERVKYGVSHVDVYSLDDYYFRMFKNGLIMLKEDAIGHPGQLTMEEWHNVLDRMIELCDKILHNMWLDDIDMSQDHWDWEAHEAEYHDMLNEFFDLQKEWIGHLWW